jgi:hypothetical protein
MSSKFENYYGYVEEEARRFVDEYLEESLESIEEGNTDMHMFIDDYRLHEWCDNDFIYVGLSDSAEILEQSNDVEEDSGLWEGLEPREAIKTQAFFTYRSDMYFEVKELFESELEDKIESLQNEYSSLEEDLEEAGDDEREEIEEKMDSVSEFTDLINDAINTL